MKVKDALPTYFFPLVFLLEKTIKDALELHVLPKYSRFVSI